MQVSDHDLDLALDSVAAMLGIAVTEADRPLVAENLRRLLAQAASVMEFPLPQEIEPAPVFVP
jgi:hypothetical protein